MFTSGIVSKKAEGAWLSNIFSGLRDSIFRGLFNTMLVKIKSKILFSLLMILYWIQIIFLLFAPHARMNWLPSSLYPYLQTIYNCVYFPLALVPLGYFTILVISGLFCLFCVLGFTSFVFVSRKSFKAERKSLFVLTFLKYWILLCQTVLLPPMVVIYTLHLTPDLSSNVIMNFPDVTFLSPKHWIGISFTILSMITFIPIFFIGAIYFHEPNSDYTNITSKRPDYVHMINGILIIMASFGNILMDSEILRYVLPLIDILASIFFVFTLFLHTPYFDRSLGKVPAIGTLVLFWTSALSCLGAYTKNQIEGLLEIWLVGVPFVVLIGIFSGNLQLKPLYEHGDSLTEKKLILQLTLLLQLINEDKTDSQISIVLDGFTEIHIEKCTSPSCPISSTPSQLNEDELNEIKSKRYRLNRFLSLTEVLFEEGVKRFEDSVPLRLAYIALLVDRFKKRRVALVHIQILEAARPSGQYSFLLYLYKRKVEEFEVLNIEDGEEDSTNDVANEYMVFKFKEQMDLICCFFFEIWLILVDETPNLDKVIDLFSRAEKELGLLQETWNQLSLYSLSAKLQNITLLSRFYFNILNDSDKAEALMNDAKIMTMIISEKQNNFMNLRASELLSNISSPIISISADSTTLGQITDTNNLAVAFFKYEKSELLNKNIKVLLPKVIRGLHQGYLRKAFVDKKKSFNREKPLFANSKDGYLVQIYLTVKLLTGFNDLFVGKFRTPVASKFTAMLLTNEEGIIDSFSSGCEPFFNLSKEEIINLRFIDSLIPNSLKLKDTMLNRGLTPVPEEMSISRPGFNVYIDISSYSHPNMESCYYVYHIVMDRIKSENKQNSSQNFENEFNFTIHQKKKKIVARKGLTAYDNNNSPLHDEDLTDSQIKLNLSEYDNYDSGIKNCRLEKGELMQIMDKEDEDFDSQDNEDEMRRLHLIEKDEFVKQEEHNFQQLFALKKPEFRRKLAKRKIPKSLKLFGIFLLLTSLCCLVIFSISMIIQSQNIFGMKGFLTAFKSISNLRTIVQRGVNIAALNFSENPDILFNSDRQTFFEVFSQTVLSLEVTEMELQSNIDLFSNTDIPALFNKEDIKLSTPDGIQTFNYWKSINHILTQSFVLKHVQDINEDASAKEVRLQEIIYFYKSINGDFWNRTEEIKTEMLNSTWKSIEISIMDWIFFIVHFCLFALMFISIAIYQYRNNYTKTELLLNLVEINTNRIKHFCRKSNLFRKLIASGENEDPQDLEYLVNDHEFTIYLKSQKIRYQKIRENTKYHPMILIKLLIGLVCMNIIFFYAFITYSTTIQSSESFIPVIDTVLGVESDLLLYQNRFFAQALYPEVATDFEKFNTENINSMFNLMSRIMGTQVNTTYPHSSEYTKKIVKLFSNDLCLIWSDLNDKNSTITKILNPNENDCQQIKNYPKSSGLVSNGLTYSFIVYNEMLRDLIPVLKTEISKNQTIHDNHDESNQGCVFEQKSVEGLVNFHYLFLQEILADFSEATISDITTVFIESLVRNLNIFLSIYMLLMVSFNLVVIIPYLKQKYQEMMVIRSILLVIPDLDLEKSETLRTFVYKILSR